jgi:hypothetical protein
MLSQNLGPLNRSTCGNFFDSPLLTVVRTGHVGCRHPNQQTSIQKDFRQPVQRLREASAHRTRLAASQRAVSFCV